MIAEISPEEGKSVSLQLYEKDSAYIAPASSGCLRPDAGRDAADREAVQGYC